MTSLNMLIYICICVTVLVVLRFLIIYGVIGHKVCTS